MDKYVNKCTWNLIKEYNLCKIKILGNNVIALSYIETLCLKVQQF